MMKATEVALLAEGVDRNDKAPTRLEVFGAVPLPGGGVERNSDRKNVE